VENYPCSIPMTTPGATFRHVRSFGPHSRLLWNCLVRLCLFQKGRHKIGRRRSTHTGKNPFDAMNTRLGVAVRHRIDDEDHVVTVVVGTTCCCLDAGAGRNASRIPTRSNSIILGKDRGTNAADGCSQLMSVDLRLGPGLEVACRVCAGG
jgi:hypothetical protein